MGQLSWRWLVVGVALTASSASAERLVATFSIVAVNPETGEAGVAVASKFFAVGSVVPWVRAGAGAVATQSYANTDYGPRGLDAMAAGKPPDAVIAELTKVDEGAARRQVGMVSASGQSATFTGGDCLAWAGGRRGAGYAIQGNILAGESVVTAMEKAYLETEGDLADRLFAALEAGDAAGGDARGRQSAALVVARAEGGYGGYNDRYIDIRVDDHAEPIVELGRLVGIAQVNGLWNVAWTAFTRKQYRQALEPMERTAKRAAESQSSVLPEVLYDLAVIRGAAGEKEGGLVALARAIEANPKLRESARTDSDLAPLRELPGFAPLLVVDAPP